MFGYEKGAFTGADKRKLGRFELANNGSIFLDEIGDVSPSTQVKLLRVLQNKEIMRVGGEETISVNVRTIAATNRDLEDLMKEGSYREDLYYRLNVFPIFLPSLRERKEDIPDLIAHFMKKNEMPENKIEPKAVSALMNYSWPGNIRELENIIERMIIMAGDDKITVDLLPPQILGAASADSSVSLEIPEEGLSIDKVELDLINNALKKAGGNKSNAAKLLGITRRKLYSMMERLGRSS